jgi:hypothetical protein
MAKKLFNYEANPISNGRRAPTRGVSLVMWEMFDVMGADLVRTDLFKLASDTAFSFRTLEWQFYLWKDYHGNPARVKAAAPAKTAAKAVPAKKAAKAVSAKKAGRLAWKGIHFKRPVLSDAAMRPGGASA